MLHRRYSQPKQATVILLTTALAAVGLISCSSSGSPADGSSEEVAIPEYYPADYTELVEASRGEDPLDVYSIMSEEDWAPMLEEFNKLYPWIDVRTVDLGTTEVFERYYAESATGSPTADIVLSIAADGWQRFIDRGEIEPYTSAELDHLPEWMGEWADEGVYAISTDPYALVVNTAVMPDGAEVPQSWEEVVDLVTDNPDFYKGKVATYAGDAQWGLFWYTEQKFGDEFWDAMSSMKDALRYEASGGAMGEKLVTGEYALALFVPLSTIPRGSDSFLKFELVNDGQPISDRLLAITKEATSPNSAKLLIDFVLSRSGQLQVPNMERVPYREDVRDAVEETGWWHLDTIIDEVGEEDIVHMEPNEEILTEGEYERIVDGFAELN